LPRSRRLRSFTIRGRMIEDFYLKKSPLFWLCLGGTTEARNSHE
jgi:hypothetical protein